MGLSAALLHWRPAELGCLDQNDRSGRPWTTGIKGLWLKRRTHCTATPHGRGRLGREHPLPSARQLADKEGRTRRASRRQRRPPRPPRASPYLGSQHLLLGLDLLLLARRHLLKFGKSQIHPRTINLQIKHQQKTHLLRKDRSDFSLGSLFTLFISFTWTNRDKII